MFKKLLSRKNFFIGALIIIGYIIFNINLFVKAEESTDHLVQVNIVGINSYNVVLNTEPENSVNFFVDNEIENNFLSTKSLTFTPENWNIPQTVIIQSSNTNPKYEQTIITYKVSSKDKRFNNISVYPIVIIPILSEKLYSSVPVSTSNALSFGGGLGGLGGLGGGLGGGIGGVGAGNINNSSGSSGSGGSLGLGVGSGGSVGGSSGGGGSILYYMELMKEKEAQARQKELEAMKDRAKGALLPQLEDETCNFKNSDNKLTTLVVNKAYKHPDPNRNDIWLVVKNPLTNIDQCYRRAFESEIIFHTYFEKFTDVVLTKEIDFLPADPLGFMPVGPRWERQYGAIVKSPFDPTLYLLIGKYKYSFASDQIFQGLGYKWHWVEDIDKRILDQYELLENIDYLDHHPVFSMVKYHGDNKIYQIVYGEDNELVKRQVLDSKTYRKTKYRPETVVEILSSEKYKEVLPLTEFDL